MTRSTNAGCLFLTLLLGLSSASIAVSGKTAGPLDTDLDGVADRGDLCPGSPAGAKIVALGCSALEIALTPQTLVDAVSGQVGERRDLLARTAAYAPAVERLDQGRADLALAAAAMRRGEPCAAADLADQAAAGFTAARREIAQTAADGALIATVGATRTGEEPALGAALLPSLTAQPALHLAAQAAPLFRAACSEVTGRFTAHGRVAEVYDAARTFRFEKSGFDNGDPIGLAEGFYRVGPVAGMEIRVSGITFADGSRLATSVRGAAPREEMLKTQQCLNLVVAPFQKFPPYSPSSGYAWGTYALEAYTNSFGVADLEKKQRFAARDVSCPGSPIFGTTVSYFMKIDVTQGANSWTIATNLKAGDVPVALPSGFLDNTAGQVTATVQKTTCLLFGGCTTTTLGTHTAGLFVRPTGTYATAIYDKTLFDVGGNGVIGDFDHAQVTGFNLSVISNSNNPSLYAKGYQVANNNADPFDDWIYTNSPFAIYDWDTIYDSDFYDEQAIGFATITEFNRTGVDRPSGLIWPEVRGQRNGLTFAYSVKVPTVVRDRIVDCSGSLDSFYETPFIGTGSGLVTVSKGSFDDPVSAHTGTASFALDFSGPSGQKVYAARPGVVVLMDDSNATSASEPADGAIGNYVLVDHQDSSFGLYYHLAQGSVPDGVGLGTRVLRDTHIGNFGSNKLHFEAGDECHPLACSGTTGYDSVKVLYDAWVATSQGLPPVWTSTHKTCYVPRVGDHF